MKSKILLIFCSFCFIFSNIFTTKAENLNITDNNRIYEPFNLSETKNLNISGSSVIDFSNFEKKENYLNGLYKGQYKLSNQNDGNSTVKLGLTFSSSIENLKYFSLDLDGESLDYKLKFLNDKFKVPTGNSFYKEIADNISSDHVYDIKNFKKEDIGNLRIFNLEAENIENLKYEIIIKYDSSKTKVFLSGGKDITLETKEDIKNNSNEKNTEASDDIKVLKLVHDLSGKYKTPTLYTIGNDFNVVTKVYSEKKEISNGYRENIEKKSISVLEYFKEMFLTDFPENIREKISDENLFEIFSESFDKVLSTNGYDNLGLLKLNNEKQLVVSFEFPLEAKKEKIINVSYPLTTGITTVNSEDVMKLNLETSAFSTFSKFGKMDYKIMGNKDYRYIVDSNIKYKNLKEYSIFSITKLPDTVVETLLYKENFLKGITKRQPKSYTNYILPIFGLIEVVAVIYFKERYFKNKKLRRKFR